MQGWGEFLKLALPGTLMLCAEWWGFEVTVIAVGLIGQVELAAHTIAFNVMGICWMIPLGLSVGWFVCSPGASSSPHGGGEQRQARESATCSEQAIP